MVDPVFCNDGYTYDWATASRLTRSPYTRAPLRILGRNVALRSAISQFQSQRNAHVCSMPTPTAPTVTADRIYSGQTDSQGRNHGFGSYTRYRSDSVVEHYDGMFEHGYRHGYGVYTEPSGLRYASTAAMFSVARARILGPTARELRAFSSTAKPKGRGTSTGPAGQHYVGGVGHGRPDGKGIYTEPDGKRYEGMFLGGAKNGRGVQTWPQSKHYDGGWRDNQFSGGGVLSNMQGERYDGTFETGLMHGRGVYTWPDGGRYDGVFDTGRRVGEISANRRGRNNAMSLLTRPRRASCSRD